MNARSVMHKLIADHLVSGEMEPETEMSSRLPG